MKTTVNLLKQADIFYQFTQTQLEMVANLCQKRCYGTGEIIFYEHTNSDELYIITQGEIDILINPSLVSNSPDEQAEMITIATLRRGQSFGEIALVDQGLRSATARAARDNTNLLVIVSEDLKQLCETYPRLGFQLMYNLAADLSLKIRNTDLRIREELLYSQKNK